MSERFYLDYSGEYGTIIRDSLNNDEDVYEYGVDELISEDMCDLFNNIYDEGKEAAVDMLNDIIRVQQKNTEVKQLKQQLEDCEFANRTEKACHRVAEEKLKKENEELKDTVEYLREKDRCNFLTAFYDGFDFNYTMDKESFDEFEDVIHLKDRHTSIDFKDGILTMIVDPPERNDKIKIRLRAARLGFELIR